MARLPVNKNRWTDRQAHATEPHFRKEACVMSRFWRTALALVLAGLCAGTVLPARASSWNEERDDLYWTGRSVERLLSEDFLDGLRLTPRQRQAIGDLRRDGRFERRSEHLDDLKDILGLVIVGDLLDSRREGSLERDLDYLLRTDDDFLYRFYQILEPDQRRLAWERMGRWYDNGGNRGWHFGRVRWELSRELERRLNLTNRQKKEIDRILRDAAEEMRDRERRLMRLEREYFRRNWEPFSARSEARFRRDLLDARRDALLMTRRVRERIRSVLDPRQRRIFDSWRGGIFEPYRRLYRNDK